jgi:ribosome biogenesis GTPase
MTDLTDYGFIPSMRPESADGLAARVTSVQKERYELVCEYGAVYGRLKSGIYYNEGFEEFPTAGDFVLMDYNECGDSRIVKTLARKSFFSRRNPTPGRGEQAVAANFDYVFVMASLNRDFNRRRLERYLALAWQSRATPVIVLTKSDLAENPAQQTQAVRNMAAGVSVHAVSIMNGNGISALAQYLTPCRTVVFLGSAGVGKSSLVNTLAQKDVMDVKGIREDDGRGRHTTTRRQLIMLKTGAMIIDTPGMRELGMWEASAGLNETFSDVERWLGKCRFTDCRHESEPGCAVKQAMENGELTPERWNSYRKLRREVEISTDMASVMQEKRERNKAISKMSRQMKKRNS